MDGPIRHRPNINQVIPVFGDNVNEALDEVGCIPIVLRWGILIETVRVRIRAFARLPLASF